MNNEKAAQIADLVLKTVNAANARDIMFASQRRTAVETVTGEQAPQLSLSEAHIIEAIGQDPNMTAASIAVGTGITRGGVSKILRRLETKGLIEVSDKEDNRKERKLSLTALGHVVFDEHERLHRAKLKRMMGLLDDYTDAELDVIIRALSDFTKSEADAIS